MMVLACDAVVRRPIVTPTGKPVTLPPLHPNVGIQRDYQRKLDALIKEMHGSLLYWLRAAYRANEPEMAQDGSPARDMQAAMRKLARRWQRRFDEQAPVLSEAFAKSAIARADGSLAAALKQAGMTVQFKLTAPANDVLQATIGQNVSLIKSIASEHLTQVEGMVMRSVAAGRDLGTLTKELEQRFGVTRKRAAFIAQSQNNIATATITRVRQQSLGISQAIWMHSSGGRHPRPEHVAADGKLYDVAKGMFLEGAWTWPGVQPRCRCVSRSVVPGVNI